MQVKVIPGKELESDVTLIGEGTEIKGEIHFDCFTRIHGRVEGTLYGEPGSFLVIGESAAIHGDIHCDEVMVDGFVRGNIQAKTKARISRTGRVIGNVKAGHMEVEFGAHFEGKAITNRSPDTNAPSAEGPELSPSAV